MQILFKDLEKYISLALSFVILFNLFLSVVLFYYHKKEQLNKMAIYLWLGTLVSMVSHGISPSEYHWLVYSLTFLVSLPIAQTIALIYRRPINFKIVVTVLIVANIISFTVKLLGGPFWLVTIFMGVANAFPIFWATFRGFNIHNLLDLKNLFAATGILWAIHHLYYLYLKPIADVDARYWLFGFGLAVTIIFLFTILMPTILNLNFHQKVQEKLQQANDFLTSEVESRTQIILQQQESLFQASKLASMAHMATGLAHEINNPLAAIYFVIDHLKRLLKSNTIDEAVFNDQIANLLKSTQRIHHVVNTLKSLTSTKGGDEFSMVKLREIFDDILSLIREKISSDGIELFYDQNNSALNATIVCKRSELERAFLNILLNSHEAVESTSQRWIKIQVKYLSHQQLSIQFIDSGKGIAPENRHNLFTPFFTTKEVNSGMGIGLSYAASVIKQLNGEIYFDFYAPHTTLTVNLPVMESALDESAN